MGSLVERGREVERLTRLATAARAGEARVVLIEGAPGVGKTRLLNALREQAAADGMRVLSARCSELERLFSFGVVRQWFEGALAAPGLRAQALSGAAAPAETLFGGAPDSAAADVSFTTLHALYWLLLNLAEERPLLLAIDDLQWCDRASLRFLAYLAARLDGQPVLLAATLRSGEAGSDPVLLGEISAAPAAEAIRPAPLSAAAVAAVVRERLGADADAPFCVACHRATGGNPLLLGQLLSALAAEGLAPRAAEAARVSEIGSQAIARTVQGRLARLPDDAAAVARAVAILGDGAELATIVAFSGRSEQAVAEAAGTLAKAEILTDRLPLAFVHPLVRDAVHQQLSLSERGLEHARAAAVMADQGASAEQVAAQLLMTARRGEEWVVERLRAAAAAAVAEGSADAAVSYLRRALEEPPLAAERPQLLLELGMAEALTSGPEAVAHLREALAGLDDEAVHAAAAPVLAQSLIFTGAPREAAAYAREAAAAQRGDVREVIEAIELGTTMFGVAEPEMVARLRSYRSRTFGPGPGAKMLAALTAWEWALTGGGAEECVALAREALADDTIVAADNGFLTVPAIGILFMADRDEALGHWERLLADSHRAGSLFAISCVHLWSGITQLRRGELVEAEELVAIGRGELQLWGELPVDGAYFSSQIGLARLERGDVTGARAELGPRPDRRYDAYDAGHLWLRTDVEVLLAEGRFAEALERSREYGEAVGRYVNPAWVPWRSLQALALDRLGHADEALALAREELTHARAWGAAGTVGRSLRIVGHLQRGDGQETLEEAVTLLEGSPARLELAKALLALGSLHRRERRPSDAREPLRRALELAERCGAAGVAAEARTELHAAGSRPRTAARGGPEALTASERRVAELAADGLTNRDIAQQLFVTPKTVEVHLSAAYRKLGIGSRRELAGVLAPAA